MIAYLKGQLLSHTKTGAIITVGGVGYDCIGGWLLTQAVGTTLELYTYHYLENQNLPRLLAIPSLESRSLLISLLDVSGVGPKMAGRILDALPPRELVTAISTGDLLTLSRVKGLGKKTAQKIILELGKTLVLDSPTASPYTEALLSLGFTRSEVDSALKETDLTNLNEAQALSALMRHLGSHHGNQ